LYFGTIDDSASRERQCGLSVSKSVSGCVSRCEYTRLQKRKLTGTLVVVDDDASVRRALQTQLRILGFKVLVFQSAEELLAGEIPTENACLLLDVYLPGMNGIALCRNLIASGRHLPTLLMSGRDDQETRQIMRESNPTASLFKPFDERTLLRAIQKAFRKG
jgi:FixJ family two-component response regulator